MDDSECILDVVVIGAGVSALTFAIGLKREIPNAKYMLFERADELGGTWRANTYPGCGSDVRIHVYSLSTEPKPDWPHTHAGRVEILDYWKKIVDKHNLRANIQFHTQVVGANWHDDEQLWHVKVENLLSGSNKSIRSKAIVSAIGLLEIPNYPSIPGLSEFKGPMFHSARWNHDVALQGKKVAVIGGGTSAAQLVTEIVKEPGIEVTQFCRSPGYIWVPPAKRGEISNLAKWIFTHIPLALYLYRIFWFLEMELFWCLFSFRLTNKILRMDVLRYMRKHTPEKYHAQMTPDYPVVCKRVIFDAGYLDALNGPNLKLVSGEIQEVTSDSVATKSEGTIPTDVVITATGFVIDSFPIAIRGKEGLTVQEYYDSPNVQGPQAYRSTTVPGFPNFFILQGPNIITGHSSALFLSEVQTNYILQLLRPILSSESRITSISPSHQATEAYNAMLYRWLAKSVWVGCSSFYRRGRTGKPTTIFPGPALLFWWWMRRPIWKDFEVVRNGDGATKED